jgi:thiamine pyrophosphokinase
MITFVGPLSQDPPEYLKKELQSPKGLLIALDGGVKLLQCSGMLPDLWFGDLDSAKLEDIQALERKKVKIFRYPVEKDFSDFELALQYLEQESISFAKVYLYGMLGGRIDHMLFNLALIKGLLPKLDSLCFCSSTLDIFLANSKQSLSFLSQPGRLISLMPFSEKVNIQSTSGLKYPLIQEVLQPISTRGLSNLSTGHEVTIEITEGNLLVFHYKEVYNENFS